MPTTRPDDEVTAWALAAKSGDRAATSAFVTATRHDVRRFVVHLVGPGDADDLVQETFLRAMKALPRFAAQSSAKTWLLAIARRAAADHIRTLARRPRVRTGDDWIEAAERLAPRTRFEDAVLLRDLIDALPLDRRTAFVSTQVLGLSYAEAAEVCGVPVGTIRSRVARARDELITALHGDDVAAEDLEAAEPEVPVQPLRPVRHLRATS